ncbi:hypothetical protein PM082_014720 [Marasmius tenuissimus]|nr:hypothetical protein PM082_014720 [Marasmius tenuissimus]
MVVSPVGPVTGTMPPPMSSVPSATITDANTSSSNPPSPTIATESNTSASNSSRAKIIGGLIGGGGFLIVLIVIFLLRSRRSKQAGNRLKYFGKAAAVIHSFPLTTPLSSPPRVQKESSPIPVSIRKVAQVSDHQVTESTRGEQFIDPQQHGGGESLICGDDNRPVDQASYWALQVQVQLLMQRMERVEGVEEGPPEYVSAYGSSR